MTRGSPWCRRLRTAITGWLIDRQAEEAQTEDTALLDRPSFNLTVGLYDTDSGTLYACTLDT